MCKLVSRHIKYKQMINLFAYLCVYLYLYTVRKIYLRYEEKKLYFHPRIQHLLIVQIISYDCFKHCLLGKLEKCLEFLISQDSREKKNPSCLGQWAFILHISLPLFIEIFEILEICAQTDAHNLFSCRTDFSNFQISTISQSF